MRPTQPPSSNQQQQAAEYELYKRIKLLGEGAFGKAYLVEDLRTHELLVQKQMDMKAMSTEEKRETQKEARILQQLNHPNIVKFKDVYTTKKGKLCIIMEYADGGDLAKVVKEARGKYLQEKQILDWFTQICLAMKHVHDRKIIHRDLKGQNIFLTRNHIVKLGDFGIARVLNKTVEKAKTMVGTPYYLSPEIIESKPYSFKTDIWSLGVILYELCALKPPFNADSLHFLALKIVKGQYSPIPNHFSREMKNLISNLLQTDAIRRPSINDIMKMPIIQERVKNFLSETIRQVEFSHTILHNKIIDAKVNLADIKMVNQEQPCPPHLIQQYMNKDTKDQPPNSQQKPSNPTVQPQAAQQQPSSANPQKGANFHYQNKPSSNPVQNYANNYRPQSARNDQVQNNIAQQQAAQDFERKKEMDRLKLEKERLELEKKKELDRIKQEKEKLAYQKLEQEREARQKRIKEQELKEKQREERERELQKIALENKQRQLQLNQANQKREEVQAGGMAVYANPNFKPIKQPVVPVKNIQLPPSKPSYNPPKSGGEKRNNSKPTVPRSGSSQQAASDKKALQQKKEEEARQKLMEQKIQRQKSEKEKRDYEMKLQKEKEEEQLKKKEDQQKKREEMREQIQKDRKKWQKGGEKQIEFVENKIGGSTPSSNNQLEKESDQDNTSNEQLDKKQKVPVKKWSVPQKANKKDDWDIQIFESKKKPTQGNQKNEDLDEYNSDEDNKQKKQQKKVSKTDKDLDEYNSDSDEDLNDRKADITAQEIPEDIEQNISKLPEIVKEETYLQNIDNTEFNIGSETDPSQRMEFLQQLQEIVGNAADNVDKLQIDEKFVRNNVFDFTKTQKTKKFNQPNQSKESLTTQEEEEVVRDDDSDEPEGLQNTGKFLDDFPEPPQLKPKQMAQDEQESINIIAHGHEGLEHLFIQLENELKDKFTLAYNIMHDELKNLDYSLDMLEKKYSDNRYSQLLDFLTQDQIDKYLRLIITLVCCEQTLQKQYNSNS